MTPRIGFARIGDFRLQYLDWGGNGDGLVFVHGQGGSPHAFDEIAPHFSEHFHVVAYARRGHAHSDSPSGAYDTSTLAEDLRMLLDDLGIRRAALVGWSSGGDEVTEFAARYPERTRAVVLLDSYAWSTGAEPDGKDFPVDQKLEPKDLRSAASYRSYWKRVMAPNVPWTPAMEAVIADTTRVAKDGSVQLRLSDKVEKAFHDSHTTSHLGDVRAPMLAMFAQWDAGGFLAADSSPEQLRTLDVFIDEKLRPWQNGAISEFRHLAPNAHVLILERTGHSALPFQQRDRIIAELHHFLD